MATYSYSNITKRPSTVDHQGFCFIHDGRTQPLVTASGDPGSFLPAQMPFPINDAFDRVSIAAAVGGAGRLDGDYSWYLALYNQTLGVYSYPTLTSEVGTVKKALTLATEEADLTSLPTANNATYPWTGTLYDPFAGSSWTQVIYRNVDGNAFIAGERPPFFAALEVLGTATTGTDNTEDFALEPADQLVYGAAPMPIFRYSCMFRNHMIGVGFERWTSPLQLLVNSTIEIAYRNAQGLPATDGNSYAFVNVGSATPENPFPTGFNPQSLNLAVKLTASNTDKDIVFNKYQALFTHQIFSYNTGALPINAYFYVIKLIGTVDAQNATYTDYYNFEVVESVSNVFYYSQMGYPGVYYWGNNLTATLNIEGLALNSGDDIMGVVGAGSTLLVCGRSSTSVHLNVSDDPEIPRWIQGTIDGGIAGHWSLEVADGSIVGWSSDGPVRYEQVDVRQAEGGDFGRWVPLDGKAGHRYCHALAKNVDLSKPSEISCVYNSSARTIEWAWTTLDLDTDSFEVDWVGGNKGVVYDITYDAWYPISGRYKLCLNTISDEDGNVVTIHGDPWGGVQKDYTEFLEGGDDEMYTGIAQTGQFWAVLTQGLAGTPQTPPNYRSGTGELYFYIVDDEQFEWTGDFTPIGCQIFALSQDSDGNFIVDPTRSQTIVDVKKLDADTRYLYVDTDTDLSYTAQDGFEYIGIGIIAGHLDTQSLEFGTKGTRVSGARLRMSPVETAGPDIYGTSYSEENVDGIQPGYDSYPQPDKSGTKGLIFSFEPSNASGDSCAIRIGSNTPISRVAVKDLTIEGVSLEPET